MLFEVLNRTTSQYAYDSEHDVHIKRVTSENTPIHVDFIPDVPEIIGVDGGLLGMTHAPGKKLHSLDSGLVDRDLDADLNRMKRHYAVDCVVTLNEHHELERMQIPHILTAIREKGMESLAFPIRDLGTPSHARWMEFVELVMDIVARLKVGKRVVIHCRAGKGRTGLVAACCLITLGLSPLRAMQVVRHARHGTIQTSSQERYVSSYPVLVMEYYTKTAEEDDEEEEE